jgi:uncharacterized protein (TIGR00661 family)
VYGVAGEGFGHSSRSHLIGQHLLDAGHDVLFVASRKSLTYLRKYFGDKVQEAFGLCLVYENRNLSPVRTVTTNLTRFFENRAGISEFYKDVLEPFDPHVVISDFEPFSAWWAWHNGVPFMSVNHQHLLTLCDLEHKPGEWLSRINAYVVTRFHYFGAAAYIVLNFFKAQVNSDLAVLAPPVVRPVLNSFDRTAGDHIVIYTTDTSWKDRLIEMLRTFPRQEFRIYGFDQSERVGNCELRTTSTNGFLADLASCRGIIATAGFSLISECLHFRKKMLLLPIQGQYEQVINAFYADRLGLALYREQLDVETIGEYLEFVQDPVPDHDDILWPDNDGFFRILEHRLADVCPAFRTDGAVDRQDQRLVG